MNNSPVLYLAPIRGITDAVYRRVFTKHFGGFDLAVAPFIKTVKGGINKSSALNDLLPKRNETLCTIPQILSKSPNDFLALASLMADLGYDTINWNIGCPHPVVTKKCMGAGLLAHPEKIDFFLNKVFSGLSLKLSIKTRLGLDNSNQLEQLLPILNRYPLEEIVVHARNAKQMYEGDVQLDIFEVILRESKHPVVFNGDIYSRQNWDDLNKRFKNANRWMIGRNALINPLLPAQIKSNNRNNLSGFKAFHDELLSNYWDLLSGDTQLLIKMKNLWEYYCYTLNIDKKTLKKIKKASTVGAYKEAVAATLEKGS